MSARAYIGTSGFSYQHWREVFYPGGVPQRRWLEYYCEHFDTVEINASYYRTPRANVCESWRRRTPEGFLFVMKLNNMITHRRRLVDCEDLLESYLAPVDALAEKLGPILVQLPPRFACDPARLKSFLSVCPPRYRWAVEFRDPSWLCEEVYALLRSHNAALVVHDLIQDHPRVVTGKWTYLRFHGPGQKYAGNYSDAMLRTAATRIRTHLTSELDVYAYFNNDAHAYAVHNAKTLKKLLA